MEKKYLPIGSICTLKGKNKKVMITGYYAIEFNGNIKISDYNGCVYPEGDLLSEQKVIFNHDDIENIDYLGYKNEEFDRFHRLLNKSVGIEIDDSDELEENKSDVTLESNSIYSKIVFDENGVVMIAEPIVKPHKKETKIDESIKFDKDGYVISVSDDDDMVNPFKINHKQNEVKEKHVDEWNIFNKYEFDEDGIVTEEVKDTNNSTTLSQIQFDENGVVIAVNGDFFKNNEEEKNRKSFLNNNEIEEANILEDY